MEQENELKKISPEMDNAINEAIQRTMKVFFDSKKVPQKQNKTVDILKLTESRLYAMPILRMKIQDDKERLFQLQTIGSPERSKSFIRYNKQSNRIDPEEAVEAMIRELASIIAADSYELETMEKALVTIKNDLYYYTIIGKYEEGLDNETIAQKTNCDTSTVWRNRQRLVKHLSIRLYGIKAIDL